jgi:hypothetical protein
LCPHRIWLVKTMPGQILTAGVLLAAKPKEAEWMYW